MPSPFPGMDPYLEGSHWMRVHTELSVEIARQLSGQLPPRYVAHTNDRFVVTMPSADDDGVAVATANIYPDAYVVESNPGAGGGASGTLTLAAAPLQLPTVIPQSVRHLTVEVRDADGQQLVTAIEVLSPSNKRGEGRDEYLGKRRRVLSSSAHLMEVDLLRTGVRVPMQRPLPAYPYFVFLSRAERRPLTDVWPVSLNQPLPTVPVPLLPGDGDVPLALQQALASVYDTFHYERTTDYTRPPEVPLRPADAAWVRDQLGLPRKPRPAE